MKIAIIGAGYVGLVSAACFAEMGIMVHCVDADVSKIERLRRGEVPIYEPGLEELIASNAAAGRLLFHTDIAEVIRQGVQMVFIAVGTPPEEDGRADLSHVLDVAATIGRTLERYCLVVTKSTVPVGTGERIRRVICQELEQRGVEVEFDIASNPEFLKEGDAIQDFMRPERVVVGVDSERARQLMTRLYKPMMLHQFRVLFMDIPSAEMTKYAANAMLATRISFMNDIANLCERVGADIHQVRLGVGSDSRIGGKFLYAGCGYGGSCFPKDVRALIHTAAEHDYRMRVLEAVEEVNRQQKEVLFEKFDRHFGGKTEGRTAAVWGLAFKPGTDDMREAPALVLIDQLLRHGCRVRVYDPIAMDEARRRLPNHPNLYYATDIYDAVQEADVLFHVTEWKEYRMPDWRRVYDAMQTSLLIDGRNVFDEGPREAGLILLGIGC